MEPIYLMFVFSAMLTTLKGLSSAVIFFPGYFDMFGRDCEAFHIQFILSDFRYGAVVE